jgi:transposase
MLSYWHNPSCRPTLLCPRLLDSFKQTQKEWYLHPRFAQSSCKLKLTDNFSISKAHEWINRNEGLDIFNLEEFSEKAPLGKYGYSRDHRPDKKQITLGITELADPINVPISIIVEQDQQVNKRLKQGSLVVFDKRVHSIENTALIRADDMQYFTARKLNKSDDKVIAKFWEYSPELID